MPAPIPPQGQQQQYTQRPVKIYGEQYHAGGALPIGALATGPNGEPVPPYVLVEGVYFPLHDTDWLLTSRYSGQVLEVIGAEEFAERFGASTE